MATVEAMTRGATKHAILGDACSQACAAVSDAARLFNVLQVSPGCESPSLSDRTRYPYLTRMTPSDRFKVKPVYEIMRMFNFKRVGILDGPVYTAGAKAAFRELLEADVAAGTYDWTILVDRTVRSLEDASSTAEEVLARDSKINMMVLPEYTGMWMVCQFFLRNMLPPDYVWFVSAFGNWVDGVADMVAETPECPCTAEQLLQAGGGLMVSGRSPIQRLNAPHGLSGRPLIDIADEYDLRCQQFGNGQGACDVLWTGYFYDSLWHLAGIFHSYLIEQNNPLSSLGSPQSLEGLFNLSVHVDYLGLTGRVRQFNSIEPTTEPPSYGDRDGVQLVRQIQGGRGNEFVELALRTSDGIAWYTDLIWSPSDSGKRVPCSSGTCNMTAAWVPSDRISECFPGTVFSVELGCVACEAGRFASVGMSECEPCNVGTFANESRMDSCRPCSAGSFSNVLGADICETCTPGFYANESSMTSCDTCPAGRYGPQRGLAECEECPSGRTTAFSGAITQDACQCQGELYQGRCVVCVGDTRYEEGQCIACGQGLICNGSRTADIEAGYFSEATAPFSVYKCLPPDLCPGGLPGTCADELEGVPCTHCPDGKAWDNVEGCAECTPLSIFGWITAALFALVSVPVLYYMMNMKQTAKATTMLATSCALAMTISMIQNVGIVGYISFSWPSELQWMFDLMSIFTLDLQAVGFDCVSSSPVYGYMMTSAMLPCALVWLLICFFLSKLLSPTWRFESGKLVSTMGQFMQVSFTIYSKIALSPMMCYTHPNGKSGMLEHNGIFCFESEEHTPMFLIGILLLAGMIVFYAMAIWATVVAPRKAASGNVWFLAATRFLLFRFRTDIWWFGTFMLPRGLMLSLSIVMAGDSPYVQMLLIVSVMLTYMVVQLISWPWKLPALNAFDAIISIALILMMAILGAFAPDLSSDIQQRLTSAVIGIITFLNVMVFLMLCVTASALIRLNVMGGSQESVILALGRIPQPEMLSNKFLILCSKIKELGEDNFAQLLSNLSIYDLRMTAQIITAVGSEVGDQSLVLARRSHLVSTSSFISAGKDKDLDKEKQEAMAEHKAAALQEMPRDEAPKDEEPRKPGAPDALSEPSQSAWL
ncbi:gbb-1 [Symbiodinium sp. CCMP2592]|nr:gbb-1 [Symbiodinium sp. CCMP2592]